MATDNELLRRNMFRALKKRNYALFFCGQGISLVGTWMQRIAISWLAYRLTNSVLLLGIISFTNQLPTFLLAPLAGVFADRWNRWRALLVTQMLALLQALLLAGLVLSDRIQVWQVIVLGAMLGVINAFDMPIRQSFVIELVGGKEELGNAIALNSSLVNGARLIGPAIAGVLIGITGEGVCFLLNAASYVAVIAALCAMKLTKKKQRDVQKDLWSALAEGFRYAIAQPKIRAILLLLALVSLMGMPYVVLMPAFVNEILHGDADMLGFLMGASGFGAIVGTGFLAIRPAEELGLERWICIAAFVFGTGLLLLSCVERFSMAIGVLVIVGFGMTVQMAASNTLLQLIVAEEKRGRIMSFYTMAFMGMAPFGSLLGGALAHAIGIAATLAAGGSCCLVGAVLFGRMMQEKKKGYRN